MAYPESMPDYMLNAAAYVAIATVLGFTTLLIFVGMISVVVRHVHKRISIRTNLREYSATSAPRNQIKYIPLL